MSKGYDREAVTSGPQVMSLIPLWIELAFTEEKQNGKSLAKKKKRCSAVSGIIPKLILAPHKRNHLLQGTLGERALNVNSERQGASGE